MKNTNATLRFAGHQEVWTEQLRPPLSAASPLHAIEEFSKKKGADSRKNTRNRSKCREQESVECSTINGTSVSHLFPRKVQGS